MGSPFWERNSKALHGASKTSLLRMILKDSGDKAHLANGDILQSSPHPSEACDVKGSSYLFKPLYLMGAFWRGQLSVELTLAVIVVYLTIIFLWVISNKRGKFY